jgi:triacylglycerol lipase
VKKKGGIEFASGADYRLTLDVYYPETVGRYPAVVMLHGGAWAWGSKLHWRRHALRLARQGFVVVTPNYRLAPKHKFPAQIDDVRVAVKWLKRHADDYHIDVTKVGAYGYSAGGHLALLLGTAPESDRFRAWAPRELKGVDSRVSVVVAGGSPADFQWLTPNSRSLVYWLGATPRERPDVYREASPLENLDRNDRVACLLYHAENDALVPPESSRRFYEKLQTLGHPSSFVMLEGMGHFWGFLNTDIVDSAAEFYRGEFER